MLMNKTDELRTARIGSLITPAALAAEHPLSADVADNVTRARQRIARILTGCTTRARRSTTPSG